MSHMKKQRDLPTTLYRILLYLSRKQNSEDDSRIQSRIERAVGIERKELKIHLENLSKRGYIVPINTGKIGRGGFEIIRYSITEPGKSLRQDIGRFIQLGINMEYYPEEFFYLPSD